jgi:hypothetical protein
MFALVQQSESALAFLSLVAEKSCEECPVWGTRLDEIGLIKGLEELTVGKTVSVLKQKQAEIGASWRQK